MSKLNRLLGLAQNALDKTSSSQQGRPQRSGGSSDWRSMVRDAADAITGEDDGRRGGSRAEDPRAGQRTDRYDEGSRPQGRGGQGYPADPSRQARTSNPSRPSSSSQQGGWAPYSPGQSASSEASAALSAEDQRAIARYDYLVRTADPDQLEQVHQEAFDRLSPMQRSQVQARMREELPASEQPRSDSSRDLARSATRLGALDPRRLTSLLSRTGRSRSGSSGIGRGAAMGAVGAAGGLLGVVAGGAIATSIGGSLLTQAIGSGIDVDALMPDLQMDLGELGALGDMDLGGLADANLGDVNVGDMADAGLGNLSETSLNDVQGFDLGNLDLGDIGGFFGR